MAYDFPTTSNLCYLIKDDQVLLIMKKRGFGKDKWNGPGGKFDKNKDKTLDEAVKREVLEETGYLPEELENAGAIEFVWEEDKKDWNQVCHIYVYRQFSGDLTETEECKPEWFKISEVPLDLMWDDDKYWLPEVLSGGRINKRFYFDHESKIKKIEEIQLVVENQKIKLK